MKTHLVKLTTAEYFEVLDQREWRKQVLDNAARYKQEVESIKKLKAECLHSNQTRHESTHAGGANYNVCPTCGLVWDKSYTGYGSLDYTGPVEEKENESK